MANFFDIAKMRLSDNDQCSLGALQTATNVLDYCKKLRPPCFIADASNVSLLSYFSSLFLFISLLPVRDCVDAITHEQKIFYNFERREIFRTSVSTASTVTIKQFGGGKLSNWPLKSFYMGLSNVVL